MQFNYKNISSCLYAEPSYWEYRFQEYILKNYMWAYFKM